ncbi:MAG: ATPase domain-containing protein [Chloroflexota bacterium]|nr:ATPase domain-containing protein [Chloroflexota bacterium]
MLPTTQDNTAPLAQRLSTGIPGLDEMLHGGFLTQTANLIEGAPGCGKTTLGMQFIRQGALHGEPGIILTFEQFPEQYYRDAASFGWDFRTLEEQGLLQVIMSSPEVSKADLERFNGRIEGLIARIGAKRILIDSLTHFERMSQDPAELRSLVYSFLNALKREGLTAVLTRESSILLGDGIDQGSDADFSFLADSYIMLRYVEIESAIHRAIIALKMRGSAHDTHIRQFEINSEGLYVRGPFVGREGIMSGTPQQMARSFIKAFIKH